MDCFDDVALHLAFLDLQNFGHLRITGVFDAIKDPRNGLDFDAALELHQIDACITEQGL